jgi:leucyl/phenylalanyl-tRNA--protein transferase
MDTAFERVIAACSSTPREGQAGTWIVPVMVQAYTAWHRAGRVHSVETWMNGELAGGLYCVGIGHMVFGESMFAHRTDASKIALAALVAWCRRHGVTLIDCQQHTNHLASFGARQIPRSAFEDHLSRTLGGVAPQACAYHPRLWAQMGLAPPPSTAAPADPADTPPPPSPPAPA